MPSPNGAERPRDSTLDLVTRARLGDETAWQELIARYEGPLRRFARGRLPQTSRSLTDTDDMVQDATLNVLKRLDRIELRFPGALLAYMRRSVQNRLVDERRRAARLAPTTPLEDEHPAAGDSPLDDAIARDRRRRFRIALAGLSPRDRLAVVMRLHDGASYEAIAEAIECPTPNAARVAVGRALHRAAELMAEHVSPAVDAPAAPRATRAPRA